MNSGSTDYTATAGDAALVPADPALPGVALLGQPTRLLEVLSRLLVDCLDPGAHVLDSRVAVRHFLPGKRCSAELELVIGPTRETAAGRRRLLGKIYNDDQGAKAYETLRELRRHGLSDGRFSVPRPLAYDADHRLLLLDWAEGESLRSRILASPDASRDVEEAALWLRSLHRCGATFGRRYTHGHHVQTLTGWKQRLIEVYPQGDRLLADLLSRIDDRGRALSGWSAGPTHRDFSPKHLVVTDVQLVGLDLDEFCQYDPLFDVAHFTAHLRFLGLTHFGALNHFDWLAHRFLASYEAGGGDWSEERLMLYEAISYLKLGRLVTLVERSPDWMRTLPLLLSEARRLV